MLTLSTAALALLLAAASAAPPLSASIVPPIGGVVRFHIVRTTQDAAGAQTASSDVTLRRKAATTATLEGTIAGHAADLTVLNVGRDGSLYIPKSDKVASQDGATVDVVSGLNRLTELFAGQTGAPNPDGWAATLAFPETHGATASIEVPIAVEHVAGTDFDLRGDGQYAPPQPVAQPGSHRGGGRRAEMPEPVFGAPAKLPYGVTVGIQGQVRRGMVSKVTINEVRTVTVDGLQFTNVSGWTIEALR